MPRTPTYVSLRCMRQLACRFCGSSDQVHVVDPLLDLRFRFDDKVHLAKMLQARGIDRDANKIETNYMKWWKAYENFCSSIVDEKPDPGLKKALVAEADGLLEALRLPNDIQNLSSPSCSFQAVTKEPNHAKFLSKLGMLKHGVYPPSADTVGLPTAMTFALQQKLIKRFSEEGIFVSPPSIVRGAVIEGVNFCLEDFISFTDGSVVGYPLFLAGHSLPSLVSLFVKKLLPTKFIKWPLRIFSSGVAYSNFLLPKFQEGKGCSSRLNLKNAPQKTKFVALSLCRSKDEEMEEFAYLKKLVMEMCRKNFACESDLVDLPPLALYNYECAAAAHLYGQDAIARIGCAGEFISQRLNIVFGEGRAAPKFVRVLYTEIDVTSAVAMIFEEHIMGDSCIPGCIQELL